MAQTYKYTIVGDTQQAVKGNEALDTSIKKVDNSTKQLDNSLQKTSIEAQKAFSQQLETRIKATDAQIKKISGTVSLFTGTISTAVGALGLFGIDEDQLAGFQKAVLSVLALGSGVQQAITGFKDLTESRKLQNEVTIASTAAENANTAALTAQAAAAGGVTVALGNAATSITSETIATEANTVAKAGNITADEVVFQTRARLAAQGITLTEFQIAQTLGIEADTAAKGANAVVTGTLTAATTQLTLAQRALNLVAKANPYIAIASILFAVGTAIFALTGRTKDNTDAEKANAEARKANEDAMRKEEDASLRLARARGASTVALAEETLKLAKNRKERAEAEFVAAQRENKFSERTQAAREALRTATVDLQVAEAELDRAREDARKKASEDAKAAKDKADALRNERLEAEGLRQVIQQLIDETTDSILFAPADPGSLLDVRNLKSVEESLNDIKTILVEIDDEDLDITFLSREQLDILKRLRGELNSSLKQQLFEREKQYNQELALFADNEEVKTQLTEEYEKDRNRIRLQYAAELASQILSTTNTLLSELGNLQQEAINIELDKLERKYQRDLQLAGQNEILKANLTRQFEARELEIQKKALAQQKALRRAQVVTTTAESIINAYNSTSTLPPPFNLIAGTALAAAYTALGAKAIKNINATTLDGGSPGGFNNIPGGGGGSFSLPTGGISTAPSQGAILPGLGGGRVATTPTTIGEAREPIRAYVLASDVSNGVQANVALNTRRRLAGG